MRDRELATAVVGFGGVAMVLIGISYVAGWPFGIIGAGFVLVIIANSWSKE
jgi:hypothetical protein